MKTLTISNATMKNQFEKEKYEYLCEDITADVKNLDISYETEVEGAKVEVLGNEELSIGVNHITVKVTSKDESEKKSIIYLFINQKNRCPNSSRKQNY